MNKMRQAILSYQIAGKESKYSRIMLKEFRGQLEEACTDQRWDNLIIKDNNFNGLKQIHFIL